MLGVCIAWLIQLTNHIALFIANLPFSYLDQLNWGTSHLLAYYLICIALVQFLMSRDVWAFKAILCLLILLQVQHIFLFINQQNQSKFTLYALPKSLAFQYQHGPQAQVWQTKSDKQQKLYHNQIQPNLYLNHIALVRTETLDSLNYFFEPKPGLKIGILQQGGLPNNEALNTLVICGKHYVQIEKLIGQNKIQRVLINADVPRKKSSAIKKILQKFKIPYHDVTENGAFEVSL
jgi:hypothetical protein